MSSFRRKLLVAMMLVVSSITGLALYFVQQQVAGGAERELQREFRAQLAALHGAQELRLAMIAERCRALVRSPRIHAALEDNALDLLYPSAREELRDVINDRDEAESPSSVSALHAKFYRFLDDKGAVIPPPQGDAVGRLGEAERELTVPGVPDEQQLGYLALSPAGAGEIIDEIVVTPIQSAESGEAIAAVVLGFKREEIPAEGTRDGMKNGLWFRERLHLPGLATAPSHELSVALSRALASVGGSEGNLPVLLGGAPHLLFYKLLNPGSRFPAAYEVCLYPLAASLARQRELQWRIGGAGALLLLAGLAASHFLAIRFAAPVQKLEVVSAENAEHRQRAEAALDSTNDELRARNAELQAALADLKSAQQHIIQQERLRALGQMASGIAHDFNNALVPILGFCELLLLSPAILANKQKSTAYLETIQTAAKDAASVVSRLREFSRPDKGDRAFASVHLKRLVEQSITLTQPKWKDQAQANGATVEIALELNEVPPVAGEESALREVLTNLIFNAVDAMPGGGTLTLRTVRRGDTAVLEVEDTGMGMPEEVRQRCLEPFFSTKGERGTGLGLSMVFGIVQRHSGSLEIRSQPGCGTTFVITLPLQDAVADCPAPQTSTVTQRSLRILVVDDEARVRETLGAVLAADGHVVEFALDGADGLKRFGRSPFDLVITDKAMPGLNGEQMAAAIKQVAPQTPIILLTGFALFHDKHEFPDVDVLASKPIRIPALREAITSAMQPA